MEWIVALRILKLKLQITMWWYLEMELWEIIRFSWGHKVRFLLTDLVFLWEEILESLVSLSLCTATEERPCHPGPRNYWEFEGKYQERKNQKENYLYWLSETLCAHLLHHVQLFANSWTVAHQDPLSMGLFRQEYWSGLSFPTPEEIQGSNPHLLDPLH